VIEQFPDEKERLEEVMQTRVNLNAEMTKIKGFCKFVSTFKSKGKGRKAVVSVEMDGGYDEVARKDTSSSLKKRESFLSVTRGSFRRSSNCLSSSRRASFQHSLTPGAVLKGNNMPAFLEVLRGGANISRPSSALSDCDQEPQIQIVAKEARRKQPGRGVTEGRQWVQRRFEAISTADWRRDLRLRHRGRLAELLQPEHSYKIIDTQAGAIFSGGDTRDTPPSTVLLRKARLKYQRPVWHEVFGPPVVLPPLTQ
jgi:hypothetical protein